MYTCRRNFFWIHWSARKTSQAADLNGSQITVSKGLCQMLTEKWTNAKILVAGCIQFGELLWWSWNALFQLCGFICLLQMLCLKSLNNLPFFGTLSVLASSSCVVMCSVSPELNVSVLQANTKHWDYSRMWTCLKDPLVNATNTKCHCFNVVGQYNNT